MRLKVNLKVFDCSSPLSGQLPKAHGMYIFIYTDLCMYKKGVNSTVQCDGINT